MGTLGSIALALLSILALTWGCQRRLVYFPDRGPLPPAGRTLPGAEDVTIETADGLALSGWFVPGRAPARGVLLVCNGNAGHRGYRAPLAEALSRAGLGVLLFDYRGYGGNPGSPSEEGLLKDARAAREYAEVRAGATRLAIFGESLGAAVALALAVERPLAALVLRSPFTSLADVGRVHYPWLPVGLLLKDRYASLERVRRLTSPLLVVAGEKDRVIPASQSRALFDAAPVPGKRFLLLPGADHNDAVFLDGEPFVGEVARFLAEALPPPAD